jgi:uncharacterized membrane protein
MVDNPTAAKYAGNLFNFVLIASERYREIVRERYTSGQMALQPKEYAKLEKIHERILTDFEAGSINQDEYLKKIRDRSRKNRKDIMR